MARNGLRTAMSARKLSEEWIHLGLGATAEPQPPFDSMQWYEGYSERVAADGTEGRLVSSYRFTEDWDMWEMHPNGAEVVICTSGAMVLLQEVEGEVVKTSLGPCEYAINPAGIWHSADIANAAEAIFITAGAGTQHRAR